MTEPSLAIGLSIATFIVAAGLCTYLFSRPLKRLRESLEVAKKELASEEKKLLRLDEKIEKKKDKLDELSKKIKRAGKKLGRISEVKNLKKDLREEQNKHEELEKEIKRMESKAKHFPRIMPPIQKPLAMSKAGIEGIERIKRRYPSLPKRQLERIEIERLIARELMKCNGGSFYVSQILKRVEELYAKQIKPNDRVMLLNEIKSWIERDPLCKAIAKSDNVQHYTFI